MSAPSIRVLIVDDSTLVCRALTDVLSSDSEITVMGTAGDPFAAAAIMRHEAPDVMILDIEMPRMDGLTFLRRIMSQHPIPVIVCSSLVAENSPNALSAIDLGAVDIIRKPDVSTKEFFEEAKVRICDAVKAAARSRPKRVSQGRVETRLLDRQATAAQSLRPTSSADKVVVIGASTGGIEALQTVLKDLPPNFAGIAIVQHLPAGFTAAFAARLHAECRISVKEARNGDTVVRGQALIAPGDHHLFMKRRGIHYEVEVRTGPLVNRHRPSVDVLFESAAHTAGANAIGVIMTGMGDDGSRGLLTLRQAGAATIAQDEATCVVYGMPAAAVKLGAVAEILPLHEIAGVLMRRCFTP